MPLSQSRAAARHRTPMKERAVVRRLRRPTVAGGNSAPLFQPAPEALDLVAMHVDEVRAAHGRFVALGRDGGSCPHVPYLLAQGVGREALAISLRETPRSATTHTGASGKPSSSPGASGASCACPGASTKAIARPRASATAMALVPKPPRERPSASRWSRLALDPRFWAPPRLSRAP